MSDFFEDLLEYIRSLKFKIAFKNIFKGVWWITIILGILYIMYLRDFEMYKKGYKHGQTDCIRGYVNYKLVIDKHGQTVWRRLDEINK